VLVLASLSATYACADGSAEPSLDDLPRWTAERDGRIGSVDDPSYAFGTVTDLQVGADGTMYSLHAQEALIRRWTSDGTPAGTIGRSGEGPGEFTSPRSLGWRGDTLWVFDSRNYRVSFFAADGTFLNTLTPRVDIGTREAAEIGDYPARPSAPLGDGSILGVTPGFSSDIVEGRLTRIAYVRMSVEGDLLDTLALIPTGPESVLGVLRDGGGTFTTQPFGDQTLASLTRDGRGLLVLERRAAAEATPAEFRLTRLSITGDTVFARGYAYEPLPIPRERVDSAVDAIAANLQGFVGERRGTTVAQWRGWVGEAIYAPAHQTPVSQLLPGSDGTIWVGMTPRSADSPEWLVLNAEGAPLAWVTLPNPTRVLLATRDALWGVEQDELDVSYVVRYRLGPGL
jgi:hypothetical protein